MLTSASSEHLLAHATPLSSSSAYLHTCGPPALAMLHKRRRHFFIIFYLVRRDFSSFQLFSTDTRTQFKSAQALSQAFPIFTPAGLLAKAPRYDTSSLLIGGHKRCLEVCPAE